MSVDVKGQFFYVGEKPRPTPFKFRKENGQLDTQWAGWTVTAYVQNNSQSESNFGCTNNVDGTGSIDWPTGVASKFIEAGTIAVRLKATSGAYVESIGTIVFKVRAV